MHSLDYKTLESNKRFKINFGGGDLSSDAGILLIKEFISKLRFDKLINNMFHTSGDVNRRNHSDSDNLMQVMYQIIAAYNEDNCADELSKEPLFTAILEKERLASQPTLSRFYNRMNDDTLRQLYSLLTEMRKVVYTIKRPEYILLDLDSTLLDTYGHQEARLSTFTIRRTVIILLYATTALPVIF